MEVVINLTGAISLSVSFVPPSFVLTMRFLNFSCALDSVDATNLVPIYTPSAPKFITASIALPVPIPPAAIRGIFISYAML